jgi:putative Holliday junction resolvase
MVKMVAEKIKNKFKIELIYVDERLSTVSAERVLIESDIRREDRKYKIDKVAASYILQTYLDSK